MVENLPDVFTGFFHQDPYFGMGRFEVNGEMMMTELLAGDRADRGDHGFSQRVTKGREFIGGAEQFHDMIDWAALVNNTTDAFPSTMLRRVRLRGSTSSGRAHRYTDTLLTWAPRSVNPSARSVFATPYS